MKREDYRFAIIGCGNISKVHAKAIQANGFELVACFDRNFHKAQVLAREFNSRAYENIDEMFNNEKIDIVNICTPSGNHAEVALEITNYNKHLIVEKPIDVKVEKAKELIQVCKEKEVILSVISQHRFDESTQKVKNILNEEGIGKLVLGNASVKWYREQSYYDQAEWRGTWEMDGGALLNQSIHTIDLLQYFMGEIVNIQAELATLTHEMEAEDTAVVTLKFASGALGTIVATTSAYPGLTAKLELHGEQGYIVIDDDVLKDFHSKNFSIDKLSGALDDKSRTGKNSPEIDYLAHKHQINDIVTAIQQDKNPSVSGEEGLKPLKIIEEIYRTAQAKI